MNKLFIFAVLNTFFPKAGVMATYSAKTADVKRGWFIVDASGKTLGRLASQVAAVLKGKNKPIYTTHVDTGDFVIIVNADRIHLTGRKLDQKVYYRHSGYPGGFKSITAGRLLKTKPERVIKMAVQGMLPKTQLGKSMLSKLKVYAGDKHPHAAQQPVEMKLQS